MHLFIRTQNTYTNQLYTQMATPQTLPPKEALTITLPEFKNEYHLNLLNGLSYLLYQFPSEFSEANHTMFFPKEQGFNNKNEWHTGNIFQRSLITDTLLDCNSWMNEQLTPLIEHEIDFLTNARRKTGVGGWAYFPGLLELAPDADDLGQMIQLYARTHDNQSFELFCKPLLNILFDTNKHTHGGFESWIIPSNNLSAEEKLQVEWANEAWGVGADTEVVSNLLYGLILKDAISYRAIIQKGIDFLWNQQEADGSWLSTWYFGPFYGTYTALRVCLFSAPKTAQLEKTIAFLTHSQLPSGGWGLSNTATPLQTSFALLALCLLYEHPTTSVDQNILVKAIAYLQRSQLSDGSWTKSSFIKMEMGRPRGFVHKTLEYGSKTITASFAVKALNKALQLLKLS